MANSGPNTNGSQFFIMHIDYPLPPSYTKFGRVTEGQDVVDAIAEVETNRKRQTSRARRDEQGLCRGRCLSNACRRSAGFAGERYR